MQTLQHPKHADSVMDIDSDTKNKPPVSKQANKKLCRSVSKTGSDDMKELKDMLASVEKSRQESSWEMVETLKESTQVYKKTSECYLEVLMTLAHN